MEIRETREQGVVILELDGRLDATSADALEQRLTPLLKSGTAVLLDCQRLLDVSSAGQRVLVAAARTRAKLALFGVSEMIREEFEMADYLSLLTVADTQEDGLEALLKSA